MTVYFIYKHSENIHPFLYAITDKKRLKDSFMKERKKSLFVVKEKSVTKEQFLNICKNHGRYLLGRRGFYTNSPSSSFSAKSIIYLTTTEYEEMDVITKEDTVILELGRYTDEDARAFNVKLLKALHELHYFEIYKFVNDYYCQDDYFVKGISSFSSNNYQIDMFGVFLYLYGHTLDKKGLIKDED